MDGWILVCTYFPFQGTKFHSTHSCYSDEIACELIWIQMTSTWCVFWCSSWGTVSQIYKCIQMEGGWPDKDKTGIRTLFECVCLLERVTILFPSGYLYLSLWISYSQLISHISLMWALCDHMWLWKCSWWFLANQDRQKLWLRIKDVQTKAKASPGVAFSLWSEGDLKIYGCTLCTIRKATPPAFANRCFAPSM